MSSWSVLKDGRLVAYVHTEEEPDSCGIFWPGNELLIAPIAGCKVELFSKEYETTLTELGEKGLDGFLFALKLEDFEVFDGILAPNISSRRF